MNNLKLDHYRRLDAFIQERIEKDIYPEIPMEPHPSITRDMINKLQELKPLEGMRILDVGCGQGLALEIFKNKQANPIGITFGEDYKVCKSKGFEVYEMDQSFLDFEAKSFDVIWCRHAIEHSLFPLFTLDGFMHVLKDDGLLYIEVPAPNTSAHHENNPNHYSCFTSEVWVSLFNKAGFVLIEGLDIDFQAFCGLDVYHAYFLKKWIA
jgi:2-polyprenyl-3-methyl-5-hydroxy-6-metoxy-1,4-benzoquinol methylase